MAFGEITWDVVLRVTGRILAYFLILRHEAVSTTQRSYIKTVPQVVTDAMNQLEARIARAAVVQQVAVN